MRGITNADVSRTGDEVCFTALGEATTRGEAEAALAAFARLVLAKAGISGLFTA